MKTLCYFSKSRQLCRLSIWYDLDTDTSEIIHFGKTEASQVIHLDYGSCLTTRVSYKTVDAWPVHLQYVFPLHPEERMLEVAMGGRKGL